MNLTNLTVDDKENFGISHSETTGVVSTFYFSIAFAFIMLIILTFSTFGGLFVCYVIKKRRLMKNQIWFYLFVLAVADTADSVFSIPIIINACFDNTILATRWICNLNGFAMMFFNTFSIMTLVAMSMRKYITISRPLKTLSWNQNREVIVFFVLVSALAVFFAVSPLLGFSGYTYWKSRKWCVLISSNPKNDKIFGYILGVIGYLLPLSALIFSSVRIYRFVKVQSRKRIEMTRISRISVRYNENKTLNTLLFIVLMFFILFTPLVLLLILGKARIRIPAFYSHIAYALLFLKSCVNPIVYCYRHKTFKKELTNIFRPKLARKMEESRSEMPPTRKRPHLSQIVRTGPPDLSPRNWDDNMESRMRTLTIDTALGGDAISDSGEWEISEKSTEV